MSEEKLTILKAVVEDLVGSLMYYDRKEDDDLTISDMDNLTQDEIELICETFEKYIKKEIKDV